MGIEMGAITPDLICENSHSQKWSSLQENIQVPVLVASVSQLFSTFAPSMIKHLHLSMWKGKIARPGVLI